MMRYIDLLNNLKEFLSSSFFQNILNNNNGISLFDNRNITLSPNSAYLIINEIEVEETTIVSYSLSLRIYFYDLRMDYQKLTEILKKIIKRLLVLGCRDININIEDEEEEHVNLRVEINFIFKEFLNNKELLDEEGIDV